MKDNFKINIEQSLKQKLKLSQSMKMSLNILKMPLNELNRYIQKKILQDSLIEVNFRDRKLDEERYTLELENLSNEKNFFEILEEQLTYLKIDKKIKDICTFIINNLDRKGYLEISKIEIKNILKVNDKDLEKSFEIVHTLEPYGIGAYSLEDCLKLQLKAKNITDNKLFIFVDNYLPLLADKKYKEITDKLKISEKQLFEYIKIIKSLNPIPSRGYNTGEIKKIVPDVFIKTRDNTVLYEINRVSLPQINLNNSSDKNLKKINEIIECIEKRFQTLDKIMEIVVREQKDFFLTKEKKQNTLRILDIASELNLSLSTVSRAIKDKYLRTDFGIISLRRLFILDANALIIQERITNFIENENKERPYTDENLVGLLKENGFYIARRTVTKYRKELGYKSSNKRKVK